MRVSLAVAFSLCVSSLVANPPVPESSSLSSSDASYDGNTLLLTGHVVLDHGLGKMMAEEASLQRQEAGKEFPFSLIQLRKEVLLALKNSAQISCGSADLDFTALKGILQASDEAPVVYSDQIKKKKGAGTVPLHMRGRQVELLFAKENADSKKAEYEVQNILAKEDVTIDYAGEFSLTAGQALYRRQIASDKTTRREFQGVISAYPKEGAHCHLSHQGDQVDAAMVDLDLINARLSLLHPKGVLASALLPHQQKGELHFTSDRLYWDQGKNTLTLQGHISIEEAALGTFHADEQLEILQASSKGKSVLQAIRTQGPSSLIYRDAQGQVHHLLSQGTFHFDREKLHATIESPEKDGVVFAEKQLYYQEEEIALYADHAALEYSVAGDLLQPTTLSLKGNIRLFSHDPKKPARFGAADRLSYSLTTRTLILSALPGKKVLFWDEAQGMRLAAPEVHITYDPATKQQQVKGIGAVQFSFTPEEQGRLQQLFPQLKAKS